MKSIKEKAIEHTEYLSDSLKMESPLYRARLHSFEAGANYVLDAIVGIINQPMNDYLVLEELWNTIEELRK